ncbi:transcription factor IIIB 70 kDa subunit-like [Bidens hawaiensis]|uniref:transcription factor IIIB 70 kDa subunit-like n=1 Tax=Bidens hawaiensis TaxID=980011 RepID=UPI00404B36B9
MILCIHCGRRSQTHFDPQTGSVCCVECGKVITQDVFTEDTEFVKDSAGNARASGNIVRSAQASTESLERTLNKGNVVIYDLISNYGISDVEHATRYYQTAVERGFTRGRRTNQVAAACVYVACREKEKPFLLIEFSSELGASVYELGTVYLQLCKLLSLQDHEFIQKPTDPSLFMHRYTSGLLKGGNNTKLSKTALQLAVSMKRDWIQTGRKPSGICAAAIYVSSVLHGYNFTKSDVKAVHICEATLTKRLIEFENTEAGSLTIEEFTQNALDYENETRSCKQIANDLKMPGITEVVCQHKTSLPFSGFGLCKECYMEFCGGLYGSEPPAFQRAEIERFSKESVKRLTAPTPQNKDHYENGAQNNTKEMDNINKGSSTEAEHVAPNSENPDKTCDADDFENSKAASVDETHTLDDIDDCEVISYLLDEEESRLKKTIWENLEGNKEYMQEQAIKQAAKEAAEAAELKRFTGTSEEIREAQAIAAAAAQEVANRRKSNKRKRELEAKNAKPAQTAAEAASQHFTKKKLSNKINHEALNSIFGDEEPNRVDDGSNKKGEETVNDDDDDNNNNDDDDGDYNYNNNDDAEWNYDNEQQMNGGYGDDDYGDDGYEGF